jgi:hypothetical protein
LPRARAVDFGCQVGGLSPEESGPGNAGALRRERGPRVVEEKAADPAGRGLGDGSMGHAFFPPRFALRVLCAELELDLLPAFGLTLARGVKFFGVF